MVDYRHVEKYKVYGDTQEWVKKIWKQNLQRFGMSGHINFEEDGVMQMTICVKPNLNKIKKTYDRFLKKLDKIGKEGAEVIYVLEDGREVSPEIVLSSEDFDKIQEYMRRDLGAS
jgi:hypothetical protein